MPTRTELIPCAACGKPRPIQGTPPDFHRAAKRRCPKCARHAQTQRLADIDELAVKFLVDGARINVTPAERTRAVAILTERRMTAAAIALRINCSQRTVVRHRTKNAAA